MSFVILLPTVICLSIVTEFRKSTCFVNFDEDKEVRVARQGRVKNHSRQSPVPMPNLHHAKFKHPASQQCGNDLKTYFPRYARSKNMCCVNSTYSTAWILLNDGNVGLKFPTMSPPTFTFTAINNRSGYSTSCARLGGTVTAHHKASLSPHPALRTLLDQYNRPHKDST